MVKANCSVNFAEGFYDERFLLVALFLLFFAIFSPVTIMLCMQSLNLNRVELLIIELSSMAVSCIWLFHIYKRAASQPRFLQFIGRLFTLAALAALPSVLVIDVPAESWDGLHFWLPRAASLSGVDGVGINDSAISLSRHPITVAMAIAWWLKLSYFYNIELLVLTFTVPVMMSFASLLGFGCSPLPNRLWAIIVLPMFLCSPLLLNMLLRVGYVDHVLAIAIMLACTGLHYFLRARNCTGLWVGFIAIMLVATLKNIGPIFSVLMFACFTFAKFTKVTSVIALLTFIGIVFVLAIDASISFPLLNIRIYGLADAFEIGGRWLPISISDPGLVGGALFHAVFVNSSFTVAFLAVLISAAAILSRALLGKHNLTATLFITAVWGATLMCYVLGLLLFEYPLKFGVAGSDTSLSRALLYLIGPSAIIVQQCIVDSTLGRACGRHRLEQMTATNASASR